MTSLVGQKLGKYQITRMIARGGMADVYRAKQDGLNRDVAIKVMHMYLAQADIFVTRFRREATSVAKMRHPHIIQLYDFDMSGDQYYMVMEYISGRTLEQLIGEMGKIPFSRVLDIIIPLTDALEYAHSLGIVHRDIKPSNVMFSDTQCTYPILADFGINLTAGNTSLTMDGGFVGTPGYMSPEAILRKPVDKRADIYSLGVVIFEMLTGAHPFSGESVEAFFASQLNDPMPDARQWVPDLPLELVTILQKCIAVSPDDRYSSIKELKTELERIHQRIPSDPSLMIADDPLRGALLNVFEEVEVPAVSSQPELVPESEANPKFELHSVPVPAIRTARTITLFKDDEITPTPIAIPNLETPALASIGQTPAIPTGARRGLRLTAMAMVAAAFILLTGNHFWVDAVSGKQPETGFSTVHLSTTITPMTGQWTIPAINNALASLPDSPNVVLTVVTLAPNPTTVAIASSPTSAPTDLPTSVPTSIPTDLPTSIPTELPTNIPTSMPTELPTNEPTVVAMVPTTIPNTPVVSNEPVRLLVGDDVVRHISSGAPAQTYIVAASLLDTLLLTVTSKQTDARLTLELTNKQTGEIVALLRPAVTAVCIRISPGSDMYDLKINSNNTAIDSDYTLRLVTARQQQLDCPAAP